LSHARVEGERDAVIIPFPLHRVSDAQENPNHETEAIVHELELEQPAEVAPKAIKRAHNVSLHALSGKSHSVAEMREKLTARELPDEAIESELEELSRVGLLDDDALARDLVERYGTRDRLARSAVEQKLRARKLPQGVIEHALAELESDAEGGLAEEAARERVRKMGSLAPAVAKRRLYSYLQRKGFSSGDISEAISAVLG
jgi:regulatory protein